MPVYTLKPGHARTFLTGVARRPGEAVTIASPGSLAPADREALEAHFTRTDAQGAPAAKTDGAPALLRNGLTEDQAKAKLRGAGHTFADNMGGEKLADLFDTVFAAPGSAAPAAAPGPAAPAAAGADAASGAEGAGEPAAEGQKPGGAKKTR